MTREKKNRGTPGNSRRTPDTGSTPAGGNRKPAAKTPEVKTNGPRSGKPAPTKQGNTSGVPGVKKKNDTVKAPEQTVKPGIKKVGEDTKAVPTNGKQSAGLFSSPRPNVGAKAPQNKPPQAEQAPVSAPAKPAMKGASAPKPAGPPSTSAAPKTDKLTAPVASTRASAPETPKPSKKGGLYLGDKEHTAPKTAAPTGGLHLGDKKGKPAETSLPKGGLHTGEKKQSPATPKLSGKKVSDGKVPVNPVTNPQPVPRYQAPTAAVPRPDAERESELAAAGATGMGSYQGASGSNKQIKITDKAMSKVVEAAVKSVPGTITTASGMDKLTGRSYPRYDISLGEGGDAIAIDAAIAVGWPAPVARVAEKTRETIIAWVADMTDVPVVAANVTVAHVEPGHPRTTMADLERFNTHPTLTPVRVQQDRPNVPIITKDWSITPHTVSGNVADSVRSIDVPKPVTITPFTTGTIPEVRRPKVQEPVALSPVRTAPEQPLKKIKVAAPVRLTPIGEPKPLPTVPIKVAPQRALKPITAPTSLPKVPVETKRPQPLKKVTVSRTPLKQIGSPKRRPLQRIVEPTSHRLAEITTPNPVRLREINTTPAPKLRKPEAPPLRLATIPDPTGHKVAHPVAPPAPRVKKVYADPVEVISPVTPDPRPLVEDLLPPERPLRTITVQPLSISRAKAVD